MRDSQRRAVLGTIDRLFRSGTASGLSDGQLLERFVTRHDEAAEAAFAALVERHGPMVLNVCRRVLNDPHDAQDAFQATFLVLMRKASSVRRRESVGSWLYGVARRVAAQSRTATSRRRVVEQAAAESRTAVAVVDPAAPDVDRALWDEVDRLPGAAREAVVLCYLEGLTHEQAALRLGWPVGTVRSRLARARDRLRGRLARRGLAPAGHDAVASALALVQQRPELLSLPAKLTESTARAALTMAARDAAHAGLVSARAATLSEGVIRTMLFAKIKGAACATFAAAAVVAGAGVSATTLQDSDRDDKPAPKEGTRIRKEIRVEVRDPSHGDDKKPSADSKEIANRINKLVAEARELQAKGENDKARRNLAEITHLSAQWMAQLGGHGAVVFRNGPVVQSFSTTSRSDGPGRVEIEIDKDGKVERFTKELPAPPVPPIPPLPPGVAPRVGEALKGVMVLPGMRDTERRLEEVEKKLDRIMKALEAKGGREVLEEREVEIEVRPRERVRERERETPRRRDEPALERKREEGKGAAI